VIKPRREVDTEIETESSQIQDVRDGNVNQEVSTKVKEFGEQLKKTRVGLNYSQEELAGRLGVKRQTLSSWEAGTTTPDVQTLFRLRQVAKDEKSLGIDLGDLLGEGRLDEGPTPLSFAIKLLQTINTLGIRNAYLNRSDALNGFYLALEQETETITIVCSSLFGVLRVAPQRVSDLLKRKAKSNVKWRILMTNPQVSSGLREDQEARRPKTIEGEIYEAIHMLTGDWGIPESSIRFYKGAPTVFLMFTRERMLLNPYTYGAEAYKTLTLEVAHTESREDIYTQYKENHFQRSWDGSSALSDELPRSDKRES
jgi:transcriptional regulator with XRE-family HTH domain